MFEQVQEIPWVLICLYLSGLLHTTFVMGGISRGGSRQVRAFIAASMGKMGKGGYAGLGLVFKIILVGSGAQGLSWAVWYLTLEWLGQENRGSNPSGTKGQHEDICEAREAVSTESHRPRVSAFSEDLETQRGPRSRYRSSTSQRTGKDV